MRNIEGLEIMLNLWQEARAVSVDLFNYSCAFLEGPVKHMNVD
jgi:hypothetical protein